MKIINTLLAAGIVLFNTSLFGQANRVAIPPPSANRENPFAVEQSLEHKTITHAAQQAEATYIPLYDSVYTWPWDTGTYYWNTQAESKNVDMTYNAQDKLTSFVTQAWQNPGWGNEYKYLYTYDVNNNLLTYITQNWGGSAWVNFFKYSYVYDSQNNQVADTNLLWNGSVWVNDYVYTATYDAHNNQLTFMEQQYVVSWTNIYLYTSTYDANNNQTSELYQTWNGSMWANSYQYNYFYDVNNNETGDIYQTWNGTMWVNSTMDSNSYDAHNNLLSDTLKDWTGGAWQNTRLYTYTYDAHNNTTVQFNQSWNGSAWINSQLSTLTYDAGNKMTSDIYQYWLGSAWVNSEEGIYTYDINENQLTNLYLNWKGSAWVKSILYSFTYDINNIKQSQANRIYDSTGIVVVGNDSIYNYFHDVLGVNNIAAQNSNIKVYPNPSNGVFTIEMKNEKLIMKNIEVYNVFGEEVYSNQFVIPNSSFLIDLSGQPGGVYLYRVLANSGELIGEGKLIVQK